MIRASGLYGRAVIDLDTAERVGAVDEIIVDPYGPGMAGYVVSCERSLFGSKKRIIIPVDAFHAIGPDALTMRSVGAPDYQTAHLDALPRLSELTGRRMVSFGGRLLGSVEDALISERDGRIIGYPLERSGPGYWLESAFGMGWRAEHPDYVRADAALRIGARLIVVPDDAIASGSSLEDAAADDAARFDRPALAAASPDVHEPTPQMQDAEPTPADADVRASQEHTTPFAMRDLDVSDAGLGLQPFAEADLGTDRDADADFDPEQDTGLVSVTGATRARSRRRVQVEKAR